MTAVIPFAGPVSGTLEAQLREFVRQQGIVVWLDLDGHYTAFVDRLIAARADRSLPYEVRAFRGSHLALMLSLEGIAAGADKPHLVIHLPGFNEDTVRETPLFELYSAGTRYRKSLDTLVTESAAGRVRADRIAAFKDQPPLTLDSADAWLSTALEDGAGGLAAHLRAMTPLSILDDLLGPAGYVSGRLTSADDRRALLDRLTVLTGLPGTWLDATPAQVRPEGVAFVAASWALSVEYVDDLKRAPVSPRLAAARELPRTLIDTCRSIATHLRDRYADFYEPTANETEALLADEVEAAKAEDLGRIDTFRFEEDKVLEAALGALGAGSWASATGWATLRVVTSSSSGSFWLRRDPARQAAWELVHHAARLGQAIADAGGRMAASGSADAGLDAYVDRGAAVDQAHRHLEQRRAALLYANLPAFEALRIRLDELRATWRTWADAWARDFNAVCRAHGFLPSGARQQRTLFEDVVRPMAQEVGTTAYFVIDAFRYEMGEELHRQFADTPATTSQLKARLAELPTVTEVGMNVLAPVALDGRLRPSLSSNDGGSVLGFSTGEFRVSNADTRKRAMHDRVGGSACPWLTLEDVANRDSTWLKRSIAQARLIVVHSRELDTAGEGGVGPAVFDQVMQKLRAAWHLLRDAGVRRFVFTADHGFLLLDDGGTGPVAHGRRIDPKRRHVLSPVAADHAGEVRVALADLGYEGVEGYLMFPETTAVFDTGKRATPFVHGGNSLQERAIPVLTVVHRAPAGASTLQYRVAAEALEGVGGMHCVRITVEVVWQGALDFGGAKAIELSLRVPERDDVEVELCQTRGRGRIEGGAIRAVVSESFELFFRLAGPTEARVQVELYSPGKAADLPPLTPDARFAVTPTRAAAVEPAPATGQPGRASWLDQLPHGGVRQIFEHLAAHGIVTEQEATGMLGSARELRRFAVQFDSYVQKAPWGVRIDVVAGVKRYVREGSER